MARFLISYSFTSSMGFAYTGKANIKAKNEDLAKARFHNQNRDCIITGVTRVRKRAHQNREF